MWRTFLTAHWETVAVTDFFTIEVATARRLVTYYVLVVIELFFAKSAHCRNHFRAGRHVHGAGRSESHRPAGRLCAWRVIAHPGPRPEVHHGVWRLARAGRNGRRSAAVRFAESERVSPSPTPF